MRASIWSKSLEELFSRQGKASKARISFVYNNLDLSGHSFGSWSFGPREFLTAGKAGHKEKALPYRHKIQIA